MHRGRCWRLIQSSFTFSHFKKFAGCSSLTVRRTIFGGEEKRICYHNISTKKRIRLKNINSLFRGFDYLRIFGFHRWGGSWKLTPANIEGWPYMSYYIIYPQTHLVLQHADKTPTVTYPTLKFQFANWKADHFTLHNIIPNEGSKPLPQQQFVQQ
jgi:hypothetical protein